MIEVKNLSKQFMVPTDKKGLFGKKKEPFWAVDSLDFSASKGSVVSYGSSRYLCADAWFC